MYKNHNYALFTFSSFTFIKFSCLGNKYLQNYLRDFVETYIVIKVEDIQGSVLVP